MATNPENNKNLRDELKKSIHILNNYIYTLKINQKLMSKTRNEIVLPRYLLRVVNRFIPPTYIAVNNDNNNDSSGGDSSSDSSDNSSDSYSTDGNNNDNILSAYAFYCNPNSFETTKLVRKDIIPYINSGSDIDFLKSITLLIYKYEGFVHFFNKVYETLEDIDNSKKRGI